MRVLVVFGGRSGEHEVSVSSARSVVAALDELGLDAVCVGISRAGRWVRTDPRAIDRVPDDAHAYLLAPDPSSRRDVDVAFPVLHGPYGEDGCVQGLFELADLPYVGAGVEGSALGMNKVVHKQLFAAAGLPVVDFVAFTADEWRDNPGDVLGRAEAVGFPSFAKPAHLGSSVGISKVHDAGELEDAIRRALAHDELILVEAFGGPREIEVGLLGDPPQVSVVGEVDSGGEFYDYRRKYHGEGTPLRIPADVGSDVVAAVNEHALRAFHLARCEGLARLDFFYDPADGRLLVNEINSLPGLTPTSMYPRVWAASGVAFSEVVRRLLDHALARHERKVTLEAARDATHAAEVSRGDSSD